MNLQQQNLQQLYIHSVHPSPMLLGGWTTYQVFKKGGMDWQDLNF